MPLPLRSAYDISSNNNNDTCRVKQTETLAAGNDFCSPCFSYHEEKELDRNAEGTHLLRFEITSSVQTFRAGTLSKLSAMHQNSNQTPPVATTRSSLTRPGLPDPAERRGFMRQRPDDSSQLILPDREECLRGKEAAWPGRKLESVNS